MALADLVDLRIEFGLGNASGTGVYGTSVYGTDTYSGSGIAWTDMTDFVQGFTTKAGKNLFQPQLKRFRTGTAILTMDNTRGLFVPGSDVIPGFLQLRPGRDVRIMARYSEASTGGSLIPPGTSWTDRTRRTWEASGSLSLVSTPPRQWFGVTGRTWHGAGKLTRGNPWRSIWQGRIDTIDNKHNKGDLTALVKCTDAFAGFAGNNVTEQLTVGAGESTTSRIIRILDFYEWPEDRRDIASNGTNTVQGINFAQDMLTNLQLTAEAEGGAMWMAPNGDVTFRSTDWESTEIDWVFGGVLGLPVLSVEPTWSLFNIVNTALFSEAGGTVKESVEPVSVALFGRRTHTRLDLINDNPGDVQTLGDLVVTNLSEDRLYIQEASVIVQDDATVNFVLNVSIGDMLEITTDTIHGWSQTYLSHVVAISDVVTPQGWVVTLGLSDATALNRDGSFWYQSFSESYHLGGHIT